MQADVGLTTYVFLDRLSTAIKHHVYIDDLEIGFRGLNFYVCFNKSNSRNNNFSS